MGCEENTKENNDALAARILGTLDTVYGTDNTPALEHLPLETQLHYATWKTELAMEEPVYGPVEIDKKLASPYKNYFNLKNEKINTALNNATHLVMGNHPDFTVRPSEVLGDDIVRPLEDAYREYSNRLTGAKESGAFDSHLRDIERGKFDSPELREKLEEIREDSGLLDALDEAREKIEDRFGDGQDDERFKYGTGWLDAQKRPSGEDSFPSKILGAVTQNITENHLKNNLVSAGRNYFDRWRAAYQFGISNYMKGQEQYKAAVRTKSPELAEAGITGSRFTEKDKGFDLFSASEPGNKGITYFAAKQHALDKGMTATQAKLYGRKAVEQLQFQGSYINRPKAQWSTQGRTNLSLLTFGLHERRWYNNLWRGAFSKDPEVAKTARQALIYYAAGNALLNGLNADIPEEIGQIWKHYAPESYRKWRAGVGTLSLARALDLSMDEISRPSITGIGMITKIPIVFDELKRAGEDVGRVLEHPEDPKKYIKALTSGSMVLPSGLGIPGLDLVGNKMTTGVVQYLYRSVMGDYERRTRKNKKYTTDNPEEFKNALRGGREGLSRQLKKDELDAQPSRRRR